MSLAAPGPLIRRMSPTPLLVRMALAGQLRSGGRPSVGEGRFELPTPCSQSRCAT